VLERLDGGPGTADSIWLATASTAHAAVNRVTTAATNRLAAAGYPVSTTKIYVTEAQLTAADAAILTIVEILGLVVVAIMLMGLVSALSVGVIERTREVEAADPGDRIDRALHAVNLADRASDACGSLSKGLRQRVALARAAQRLRGAVP
jgi:ABC-type methionine transport system ATPase subunit